MDRSYFVPVISANYRGELNMFLGYGMEPMRAYPYLLQINHDRYLRANLEQYKNLSGRWIGQVFVTSFALHPCEATAHTALQLNMPMRFAR